MNSDVLIIGGGVIGLSIARELHKSGVRRVTIAERGRMGQEASFAAAGMLAPNAEAKQADDFLQFCSESCRLYPDLSGELLEETGIDIELDRSGTLYLAFSEADLAELEDRLEWQRAAGMPVESLSAAEIREAEPAISEGVAGGLFYPEDWQVENRKLLRALRKYAELCGIRIVENTEIMNLLAESGRILGAASADESFFSDQTVIATGAWTSFIKLGVDRLPVDVRPIRGQMIAFQTGRILRRVACSLRGYLVPRMDGRVLVGATVEDAGFDKSVTDIGIESLRSAAVEIAPGLAGLEICEKWAGLRPFAPDGLPILGPVGETGALLIATAHYRNGILLAPLTARLTTAKIVRNETSDFFDVFSLDRFQPVRAASGI